MKWYATYHEVVCYFDFQSPPHRGIFCDDVAKTSTAGATFCLSVPSSSGNLLRLPYIVAGMDARQPDFQSPPHRGIFCDEAEGAIALSYTRHFQSPPHRGI